MAYIVQKEVPGILAFGGIDLNLSVGGMNPTAVEKMALTTGHLGRFVWMATYDTHAQVLAGKTPQDRARPYVAISRNGELLPETKALPAMIKNYDLVMATGHNSAEEDLLLLRESRALGITHVVVTHAMLSPINMTIPQMQEAASLGAYIEFVYNGLTGASKAFTFADYARAIRAVGPEHCILSSDMGQPANPLHPDGLVIFFTGLETDDGDDQQHFNEREGAPENRAGGASSTSPQFHFSLVSQGLAELVPPKVSNLYFHDLSGVDLLLDLRGHG